MATMATIESDCPSARTDGGWFGGAVDARRAGARLLDVDPDLGRDLDPDLRARLACALRVQIETLDVGPWTPDASVRDAGALGLLVVDGLLLRDLSINGRRAAELVGPGDLLRPWDEQDASLAPVRTEHVWHVVDGPARLAMVDRRATAVMGRFPTLVGELLDRTLTRARALQLQLALTQVHGIGQRLETLLWHFADRWGRVTPDGVVLPLNLTHEMFGRLIGARRPSVTTALRRLDDAGRVQRRRDGWLLGEGPPAGGAPLVSAG